MFGRNAKSAIDSLVGVGARIEGNLHFCGGLRIDGQVCGCVIADPSKPSVLVLSEFGRIDGEVHCANLVVNGEITGLVISSELLELQPKARILGDVQYKLLEMHGGALVTGQLTHVPAPEVVLHLQASGA